MPAAPNKLQGPQEQIRALRTVRSQEEFYKMGRDSVDRPVSKISINTGLR